MKNGRGEVTNKTKNNICLLDFIYLLIIKYSDEVVILVSAQDRIDSAHRECSGVQKTFLRTSS